jgi:O-acetylserine/cysteine efflux transporter
MPWRYIAAYGFAIGVCQFGLLFLGMKLGMPAGLSSLVIQLQIFFTIGLAVAFLGEHVHRQNVIGAAIATPGLVLLAVYKLMGGMSATFVGFVLVILSAFAWAVGNVVAKRAAAHDADMFALVVWSSLVPPLPLAALSYAFEGGPAAWQAVASAGALSWGCVLFLAWFATLFGFARWAGLMHRYPAALISPFGLLIPVSGLASGALLLGESLAPMQLAGVLLVFAGLVENVYGLRLRAWLRRVS